jgi:hypothetical protein
MIAGPSNSDLQRFRVMLRASQSQSDMLAGLLLVSRSRQVWTVDSKSQAALKSA